ncbi:substrate-binding domain-containing protein [Catellatospora sp. KI3]|uniref:VWA domain-containing protein n=1 Tax=Catellatospora sp. KI3 TaxID=3041620 RepID=UPI0024825937|nr:VWA domain-containing protein [Catellatospora sp. KI3]MDI1462081.1 substrate-binding domain-containing protein [Catellatospora sp. KI3]
MPGRHRDPRRNTALRVTAAVAAAGLVLAGSFLVYRELNAPSCEGEAPLSVAASADIVDALRATADSLNQQKVAVDGKCAAIEVTMVEPADMAAALAELNSVSLTGIGQPSGNTQIPDVWVPDSATWLARLTTAAPAFQVAQAPSIARSPVVVAMPEPIAASLGWPAKTPTWNTLLQAMTSGTGLRVGIVEPTRDAAGLSGLLALGAAAGTGANAQAAATGALRSLASGRSVLRDDLLARFPRSKDPAALKSGLSAASLSEQAVIHYNATKPPVPLAALYLEPAPTALTFPYAVMPGLPTTKAGVAQRLLDELRQPAFRDRLAGLGLRAADGTYGSALATPKGAPAAASPNPAATPSPAATVAAVDRALSTWVAVTLPARMLAVIDVSGSMLERVATAGGATRAQVTLEAARRGLGLFDDSWAVGLWTFSTKLQGDRDYKQLVPIGQLSQQRNQMLATLGSITPKPDGDTGLYDTLLAAYETVQRDWDPGRVNSVVMMTDGDNDDDNGVSLEQLLATLKEKADKNRPIQVVILAIGDKINPAPLQEITKLTGGGVFQAKDPAKIGEIFLKAISLRSANPS